MVTLVTFNHCLLIYFIVNFSLFTITKSVPLQSNDSQAKNNILVNSTSIPTTQLQSSKQPNDTDVHPLVNPSTETQIEKQPIIIAEASEHEPASVHSYQDHSDHSNGYKNDYEHKLSAHGSHHEKGKKGSYDKDWEKLKEKEHRVKDRGSGFIKAFTWDREEVSKDKYKDKGSEHESHSDHSKGGEYGRKKESNKHNSSHSGKNRSTKKHSRTKGSNENEHLNYQQEQNPQLEGQILAYDPNMIVYGSLNNLPSTDEILIQPGYTTDEGNLLSQQLYMQQPILY